MIPITSSTVITDLTCFVFRRGGGGRIPKACIVIKILCSTHKMQSRRTFGECQDVEAENKDAMLTVVSAPAIGDS